MRQHRWLDKRMNLPKRIIGRTRRLTTSNRKIFDEIFESSGGWVLDFSNRTMAEWFEEVIGINIYSDCLLYTSDAADE